MADRSVELLRLIATESQDREAILSIVLEMARSLREESITLGNYWHPLGMLRLRLAHIGDSLLKIHIWPQGVRGPMSPAGLIHTHIWPLKSYILYGTSQNTFYDVCETTLDEATNRIYRTEPTGVGAEQILRASDILINCQGHAPEFHSEGTFYDVPLDHFHSTIVGVDGYAASIILTTKAERPYANIVGPVYGAETYSDSRQRCDNAVFTKLFDDFIAMLDSRLKDSVAAS